MNCTVAVGKCALGEITIYEREKITIFITKLLIVTNSSGNNIIYSYTHTVTENALKLIK